MLRTLFQDRRIRVNACLPVFEVLEGRHLLATLVVTNVLDSGAGSLRQAIMDANSANVASTIDFSIPGGGVQLIKLATELPTIEIPTTIDGTTQPGYAGSPLVAISGSSSQLSDGLDFAPLSTGSVVRGLAIEGFSEQGISTDYSTITIESNDIGVDPTGTLGAGNGTGILLSSQVSPSGDLGSGSVISNNVISGNYNGIELDIADKALITNNFIGTDASGRTDLGNANDGVLISSGSTDSTVSNNTIANNGRLGVDDQGTGTIQSGNTTSNNGNLVANLVLTASTTSVFTTTGKIETVIYTLTNQGPNTATNVTVEAHTGSFIPNIDLTPFVSTVLTQVGAETSPGGVIAAGANINAYSSLQFAKFASLAPGASAGFAIQVLISGSGGDSLQVSVSSDQPTTDSYSAYGVVTYFDAIGAVNLSVAALPPPPAKVGQPETLTYVITNPSPYYLAEVDFSLNLGSLPALTPNGVIVSLGTVYGPYNNAEYHGDLGLGSLAPGASIVVSATIVPLQAGPIQTAFVASSIFDLDPNPANNAAYAGVLVTSTPTVVGVQVLPATGSIDYVVVQFSTPMTVSQVQNVGNYHLTTGAGKTRIAVRSATYVASTDSVILTLSKPLTRPGSAIMLIVGGPGTPGLTGIDGSKLVGGVYTATLSRG